MEIDATATPIPADHSDTSVPVQTTPAMLSAFCDDSSLPPLFKCPFAICSQHKGWRCLDPLLRHIETKHLPISTDLPNGFLTSARRWICPKCRVFIPLFRVCRLCHCCNPAQTDLAHIPDEASRCFPCDFDLVFDWEWISGLQGVIRYIPYGARSDFVGLFKDLLVSAHNSRRVLDIRKLLSMVKVILAPLPRSGRKHCSDSAGIIKERIALWRCRKWAVLKEMCKKAYDRQQRQLSHHTDDDELSAGDLAEFLPDHLAHAVVKAVDDGAISKATKMLLSQDIDSSIDVLQALQNLHPHEMVPDLPDAEAIDMIFTGKEIARAIYKFPPDRALAHLACGPTTSSNALARQ